MTRPWSPRRARLASPSTTWRTASRQTVPSRSRKSHSPVPARGGRHVELGLALCDGQRTIVVGHRENVFHWLPQIEFYNDWDECLHELAREKEMDDNACRQCQDPNCGLGGCMRL
jgi:hypothetical protein